jgi:hypothetical protein
MVQGKWPEVPGDDAPEIVKYYFERWFRWYSDRGITQLEEYLATLDSGPYV